MFQNCRYLQDFIILLTLVLGISQAADLTFGMEQRSRGPPYSIPDLSDRITRVSGHYPEAGGFADVYKCQYKRDEGIKAVRAVLPS